MSPPPVVPCGQLRRQPMTIAARTQGLRSPLSASIRSGEGRKAWNCCESALATVSTDSRQTRRGPLTASREPARRGSVEPAFELGEGDEDAAAAADDAKLADDVLVEVVAADAEHGGCLVGAERQPRPESRPRQGALGAGHPAARPGERQARAAAACSRPLPRPEAPSSRRRMGAARRSLRAARLGPVPARPAPRRPASAGGLNPPLLLFAWLASPPMQAARPRSPITATGPRRNLAS